MSFMASAVHTVVRTVLACGLLAGAAAVQVDAQRPHGVPPGLLKKGTSSSPGTALPDAGSAAPVSTPAVRTFGVWLDDATVLGAGETWLTVSAQRWASPDLHGFDVPALDLATGLTSRLQASASVPFTQHAVSGAPMNGNLGDVYAGVKYVVRDPSGGRLGVSVAPTVEVLSRAATVDTGLSRVNAVLPVSLEWRRGEIRGYASTGWYTRGAVFVAGAIERPLAERLRASGGLTYSRSTAPGEASTAWGFAHHRVDASGSASYVISPRLVAFAGIARTLSQLDPDGTRYAVSFGTSMDLGRRTPSRPPVRP